MSKTKNQKNSVRLSVTLDESDYLALSQLAASLDLSAAWMIRRAISEFIERHRDGIENDLPLKSPGVDQKNKNPKKKTREY